MITVIARRDQAIPQNTRKSPASTAAWLLFAGLLFAGLLFAGLLFAGLLFAGLLFAAVAWTWALRALIRMITPMAATVNPWSSLTKTRGSAHSTAARVQPRSSADREQASSGTAKAISWKSKSIICWRPHENPYAAPISRPAEAPSLAVAARLTGITESAVSNAWATSSVTGLGAIRKNGAINATMGWKWSPSRLKPEPLMLATGACRWAVCLTYSVKMPRSHDPGSRRT